MRDDDCVRFLQWALPHLGLRWAGFRKVRRQVCRRVTRRIAALGLDGPGGYRGHLEGHPEEWAVLDALTRVTISRFYRDRAVFDGLRHDVLPALARAATAQGREHMRVWSAGAAGGEEPYTVSLIWRCELARRFPSLALRVLATDVEDTMLARARAARYGPGSLKELPAAWRREAFAEHEGAAVLREEFREPVELLRHDLRSGPPADGFDLVLCRYLAFTYFDEDGQRTAARDVAAALRPGGALVTGTHETLPPGVEAFAPWPGRPCIHRRAAAPRPRQAKTESSREQGAATTEAPTGRTTSSRR